MVAVSTYTAEVHRERRMLVARVTELGRTTQGRDFDEVEYMVRDLIRICNEEFGTTEDHTAVEVVIKVDDPRLQAELEAARVARSEAAVATQRAAEHSSQVAQGLKAAGFTVRDIGALLGVTFQRAHQLLGRRRWGRTVQ